MASINATTSSGIVATADNTGTLQLQSAGTTSATFNSFGIGLGSATPSSGIGITFPAAKSPSSNANTLDDYEEGTWTPTLAFGGASVGITYFSRYASYTKVGRIVTVIFYFQLSSKGSSTGQAQIGGFPFAFGSGMSDVFNLMPARGFINTGGQDLYLYTPGNQTVGLLYQNVNDGTSNSLVNEGAIANNSEFEASFSYFVT